MKKLIRFLLCMPDEEVMYLQLKLQRLIEIEKELNAKSNHVFTPDPK